MKDGTLPAISRTRSGVEKSMGRGTYHNLAALLRPRWAFVAPEIWSIPPAA